MKKRRKNMDKLKAIVEFLANDQVLPASCRDHALIGNYADHRECHIEPDWLLIYRQIDDILIFERTGSHADLFK